MHLAPLIRDLAVILGVAAIITFLFRRIKQPVVLGYILAGIIVGPYTPAVFSVSDLANINVWAELGVIFLMFSLGLEFSFRKLARIGLPAGITATVQISVMFFSGYFCAKLLDWPLIDAIFLGALISVSSTTIILKALEEFGLKRKKFADLVFGILIAEDLAAIIMLVALSSLATKTSMDAVSLLATAGQLFLVVGTWFLIGMFLIPRFLRSVGHHGNDEMLTVVSIGLCLMLVTVSASFHYSVALGAFVMGSIIAETSQVKRIEALVQPLRDLFGAVFFVSVGMLLNPKIIVDNFGTVILITTVIIVGKIFSVSLGAFITGQSIPVSIRSGFSMAQIGEFSFIIATLGQVNKVTNERLYPIAVATSLITTFTTPFLIKMSGTVASKVESSLPTGVKRALDVYVSWTQRHSGDVQRRKKLLKSFIRWIGNGIAVSAAFTVTRTVVLPWVSDRVEPEMVSNIISWSIAFLASIPFIWGMLKSFKEVPNESHTHAAPRGGVSFVNRVFTILVIGLLSLEFFPLWISLIAIVVGVMAVTFFFRPQVEAYSSWLEREFKSGFEAEEASAKGIHALAPWDAHLVEATVHPNSSLIGRSLIELELRERFGLNIVVIKRGSQMIVAPKADERIFPADALLCFGTDDELQGLRPLIEEPASPSGLTRDLTSYELRQITISHGSPLQGRSIRDSGIRETFECIVVGVEREDRRISNPKSDYILTAGDVLWIVGESVKTEALANVCNLIQKEEGTT